MSLFPISRLFPTCFGPSWAHHQGYFKLLFLCYHLVHAVLCSALLIVCVHQRTGLWWWLRCTSTPKSPPQTSSLTHADDQQSTAWTKWEHKNNSLKYPWWWAHEGPKHVGKRREKGNKDIVQNVASVGNSYCNISLSSSQQIANYIISSAISIHSMPSTPFV